VNPATATETAMDTQVPPRIEGDDLVWDLELPSRSALVVVLRVTMRVNDRVLEPMHEGSARSRRWPRGPSPTGSPRFPGSNPTALC
jgi:hypothetical protein